MIVLAIILATVGSAALTLSARVLIGRRRRPAALWVEQQILCEAPSPDDGLKCDLEMSHWGWHSADGSSWFGSEWSTSEYDDTQAGPTQAAPEPKPAPPEPAPEGRKVGPMGNRRNWYQWHDWGPMAQPRFRPYPMTAEVPRQPMPPAPTGEHQDGTEVVAKWMFGLAGIFLVMLMTYGCTRVADMGSSNSTSTSVETVTAFTSTVVTTVVTPTTTPRTYQPTNLAPSPSIYSPTNTPPVPVGNDAAFLVAVRQTGTVGEGNADDTLIDMAHGTCRSMDANIAMDASIEHNAGLAFAEAKAEEASTYRENGWRSAEKLIDLAMQYYCPNLIVATPANLTPADATFANGWIALKGNVLGPLVGVMEPRALEVCRKLQREPEWQVVDDVDATDHGNNTSWKQAFVDLAKEAYCPGG